MHVRVREHLRVRACPCACPCACTCYFMFYDNNNTDCLSQGVSASASRMSFALLVSVDAPSSGDWFHHVHRAYAAAVKVNKLFNLIVHH